MNSMRSSIPAFSDLRVAIVSSSPTIRQTVRGLCRELDISKAIAFKSTHEAFAALHKEPYDLVISHWTVGVVGAGLDLVEMIRKDDALADLACIIMSGDVDKTYIQNAVDYEIDEFLAMPFTSLSMKDAIVTSLNRRKYPSPYEVAMNQTKKLVKNKDFDKARTYLLQALTLDKRPANAYYFLGYIAMVTGKKEEAFKHFEEALKARPFHLRSLFGKAFLLKDWADPFQFLSTLRQILSIFPTHGTTFDLYMEHLIKHREFKTAADRLYEALLVRSDFPHLNPIIEKYAITIFDQRCRGGQGLDFYGNVMPSLKVFAKGKREFSIQFIKSLFRCRHKDDAEIEYGRHKVEFGPEYDLEYAHVKAMFFEKKYAECINECWGLNEKFGPHEDSLKLIVRSYIRLKNKRRARESLEELHNLQKANQNKKAS